MNCDRARATVSERMDGERLPSRVTGALESHLADCAGCRDFARRAGRVRTAVRIRPAESVPDLVDSIMSAIAREARTRPRRRAPAPTRRRVSSLGPVAAALVVGLVAGSVAVGGPWQGRGTRPEATAGEVIRGVHAAARRVEAYHATYAITEHGLAPAVPTRSLEAELWFAAPGRYRLEVHDHTSYPNAAWTPTDLTYVTDGTATRTSGPSACPSTIPPATCPPTRSVVSDRSAVSAAPLTTDLVVPLDVLSNDRGITVVGTGTVLGRPAIEVELTFERAAPLFPFMDLGGTWRPFFATDRVELWVDARSWSPLRWTVYPSTDPARPDWELRFGLPSESPDRAILAVAATGIDANMPAAGTFSMRGPSADVPISQVADRAGFPPITPTATGDLALTAAAVPSTGGHGGESLLTYSDGVAYLRVGEHRRSATVTVGDAAERVRVAGGVAYYEPATAETGRRVTIHTAEADLVLETNLPREDLLRVAASLPVRGEALPRGDRTQAHRLSLAAAQRLASFPFSPPTALPTGYVLAGVERTVSGGTEGITMLFHQQDSDLGGEPIRLYLQPAAALPPAASASQVTLQIAGVRARWTPSASRLEWIRGGVYASLDAPGVDLPTLASVAASVEAGG